MPDSESNPAPSPSRDERIGRIVSDFREALQSDEPPTIDQIVSQNDDLDSELLRHLLTAVAGSLTQDTAQTQVPPPEQEATPNVDETQDWTPADETTPPPTPSVRSGPRANRGTGSLGTGTVLGEYQLESELGRGGMGVVYKAEHTPSQRSLALKVLSPDLPRSDKTVQRFLNEASLAAALSHPRTTFVYEAGQQEGHFFISMELMPGKTLRDVVSEEGPLPVTRAVDYILDVLDGLEAAHESGVVHRDVKPSNCFLDDHGRVKVGDFGLSKSLVAAQDLTMTGTFLGTPQFAAPEQFGRGDIDTRTDVFAAAGTLYYLLAGEAPFTGDAAAVIAQIVADDPPPLDSRQQKIPRSLSRIVAKALNKKPEDRFQSAGEFRSALTPFSSRGSSMADVGRRTAAFFIDIMLVNVVVWLAATVIITIRYGVGYVMPAGQAIASYLWISGTIWLLYYAISEGIFARSLGKTWLSLRVVNEYGEPPGFLRAVVRAFIVPGLTWVTVDAMHWYYGQQINVQVQQQMQAGVRVAYPVWSYFIVPQLFTLIRAALFAIVCSTMRRSNGYRGLHEFLSGTRVIRHQAHEAASRFATLPSLAYIESDTLPARVGRFQVVGKAGYSGDAEVLVGRDDQLARAVWIYRDIGKPFSKERTRLSRATRQRWLSDGKSDAGEPWLALESLRGAPLSEVARFADVPWGVGGQVWLQTAEELQLALADQTIPQPLLVEQVWVDRRGSIKLADLPLSPQKTDERASNGSDDSTRAVSALLEVGATCTTDDETPAEAIDLIGALRDSDEKADRLISRAVEGLRRIVDRPYRLRWDDRLGIVAISGGLETTLFSPATLILSLFLISNGIPVLATVISAVAVGLAVIAAITWITQGGPAFWLTKTSIRDQKTRQPASTARQIIRNLIAWGPISVGQALAGLVIFRSTGDLQQHSVELAVIAVSACICLLVQTVGLIYAIVRPRRGLQDLLAGTYLVRRADDGGMS